VYLRTTVRRTKGGELVRYVQLAHNERNARGVPVARVIHNFGREDLLDREGLVRLVRYADSRVGRIPTQIDYDDYREVSGIKMPFRWTVTSPDWRETFELSDVQPNAPIDAAKFAKPAPPAPAR
jgi:hypothetical protein